ncbi:MAG: cobalamin biosynthesis protein CbiM [Deltaproteobacteria bacterium]|nr:MAG: cobalamin biosynthesis protein CbiM [Deltaproteobacteria bacterium]
MHMADALLSPAVGGLFWAGSAGTLAYSAGKIKEASDEKLVPLMGVMGAFVFAAQMINFTIPGTGSSGHFAGGMLLAILLGPYPAFLVMASVLTVQALFFADGGLLALGANIWNMAFYPCFVAYPLIYRPLVKKKMTPGRITAAAIAASVVSLELGALSVVIETLLSGITDLTFGTFLLLMLPVHLAIGLVEGLVTAGIVNFVRAQRPEVLEHEEGEGKRKSFPVRGLVLTFLVLAILTGGILSWYASEYPDGLEWSIEKVTGKTELEAPEKGVHAIFQKVQEKTALLPDYSLPPGREGASAATSPETSEKVGTSLSGVVGSLIVLAAVVLSAGAVKIVRRKRSGRAEGG